MAYTSREFEAGTRKPSPSSSIRRHTLAGSWGPKQFEALIRRGPPGSKFHHVIGFGPLRLADSSEVL